MACTHAGHSMARPLVRSLLSSAGGRGGGLQAAALVHSGKMLLARALRRHHSVAHPLVGRPVSSAGQGCGGIQGGCGGVQGLPVQAILLAARVFRAVLLDVWQLGCRCAGLGLLWHLPTSRICAYTCVFQSQTHSWEMQRGYQLQASALMCAKRGRQLLQRTHLWGTRARQSPGARGCQDCSGGP